MTTVQNTLGPLVLGTFMASILYGVQVSQVYQYYSSPFTQDKLPLKTLVYGVCILETVHIIFVYIFIFDAVIIKFGVNPGLEKIHWGMSWSLPVTAIISGAIQSFFAHRIHRLSKQRILTFIIWIACVARFGASIAIAVISLDAKNFISFVGQYHWLIVFAIVLGTAIDVANTMVLCLTLWRERKESNVAASRRALDRIMIWSIETGFLTRRENFNSHHNSTDYRDSFTGIIMIICMLTMLENLIWMFFIIFLAKMYSNTLLSSLNGRNTLRAHAISTNGNRSAHMISTLRDPTQGHHDQELEVRINIDRTSDGQANGPEYGHDGKNNDDFSIVK
ncbi:hypothetical protein C8J56DRAFT_1167107 [Mycena floridula]|nr:hypothetical protein C8J56DRAFT_1167107 [Mycena floridula]